MRTVLARATEVLDAVLSHYRDAVTTLLGAAVTGAPVEWIGGRVVARVVGADRARREARANLAAAGHPWRCVHRIQKLKRSHHRWVGPVRVVSKSLPTLWGVPVLGPVPAAPIAAVALLGWTMAITGDQLDAAAPFPNVWKGVVQRAAGK